MIEKLHRITVPTPFYVGPVNAYLLEGDPLTLFDCGPRTEKAYDGLVAGLAALGYRVADIAQLVISHHHTDHVGLAQRVISESGAQLVAHQYTVPYLEHPIDTRHRDLEFFRIVCQEGGVPESMLTIVDKVTEWVDQFGNLPVSPTRIVNEGDTIETAATTWQVYYTPGHAGDSISLFDPVSGVMLAFDHLILKISSNPLVEPSPVPGKLRPRRLIEYMREMQRMASLNPRIAYSGHGDPIEDVPGLVAQRLKFHHQRADKILGYFADGPANLWETTQRMFSHIQDTEKFLAISEVLGHIDLLENEGKLHRETRDNVVYWHIPS